MAATHNLVIGTTSAGATNIAAALLTQNPSAIYITAHERSILDQLDGKGGSVVNDFAHNVKVSGLPQPNGD